MWLCDKSRGADSYKIVSAGLQGRELTEKYDRCQVKSEGQLHLYLAFCNKKMRKYHMISFLNVQNVENLWYYIMQKPLKRVLRSHGIVIGR